MDYKKIGCVFACIGRALEWHSRGQEFDPLRLHQKSVHNRVRIFLTINIDKT